VQSPQWRALSDEDKQADVTSLMKKARVEARRQLFGVTARRLRFKMDGLPPLPAGLTVDQ
jgi:hypothetical protein